jgi:hypothetical protein
MTIKLVLTEAELNEVSMVVRQCIKNPSKADVADWDDFVDMRYKLDTEMELTEDEFGELYNVTHQAFKNPSNADIEDWDTFLGVYNMIKGKYWEVFA